MLEKHTRKVTENNFVLKFFLFILFVSSCLTGRFTSRQEPKTEGRVRWFSLRWFLISPSINWFMVKGYNAYRL